MRIQRSVLLLSAFGFLVGLTGCQAHFFEFLGEPGYEELEPAKPIVAGFKQGYWQLCESSYDSGCLKPTKKTLARVVEIPPYKQNKLAEKPLEISTVVYFGRNKSSITPANKRTLIQFSAQIPDRAKVNITGYADSRLSKGNERIALLRAKQVAYYIQNYSKATAIEVVGKANCCYAESNETEAGRAKNRRVEIFVKGKEEGN